MAFFARRACALVGTRQSGTVLGSRPWRLGNLGRALASLAVVLAAASDVASASAPRLWCTAENAWIYREPRRDDAPLGALLRGDAVTLNGVERIPGKGCPGGFFAIQPRGYICDDFAVTPERRSRRVRGLQLLRRTSGAYPFQYAISDYAPMYRRLPTPTEVARFEGPLGRAGQRRELHPGHRGHERLAEARPVAGSGTMPWFLRNAGSLRAAAEEEPFYKYAPAGTTLAYSGAFEVEGRTWLASPDGSLVPADRVRPFRHSRFRGVLLDETMALPIAWLRKGSAARFYREANTFEEGRKRWPLRAAIPLDPSTEPVTWQGARYLRTRECEDPRGCAWVPEADATVARAVGQPWWQAGESERSIVVSISKGTLVAYEGKRPVFATLVSPGAGGVPREGVDPVKASTTPLGVFRITYKVKHTTMSPEQGDPKNFWMAEVPHTQYFNMPFALHAAYWHEDFGMPMSAGCINASPLDAKWLFEWTKPHVPEAWGGATTGRENGLGSFMVVVR